MENGGDVAGEWRLPVALLVCCATVGWTRCRQVRMSKRLAARSPWIEPRRLGTEL